MEEKGREEELKKGRKKGINRRKCGMEKEKDTKRNK
jgi:hypothetical protein